jgi:hypothetical protein
VNVRRAGVPEQLIRTTAKTRAKIVAGALLRAASALLRTLGDLRRKLNA